MVIDQATQLRLLVQGAIKAAPPGADPRQPADPRQLPEQQPSAEPRRPSGARLASSRRRAAVVAVTSGKGGVGKSNVSVNLAIKLASSGKRVVLLDADLGLANADVLCNVDLTSNLSHVIGRKKELRDVLVDAPGGFQLIGGASGLARMADLSESERQRLVDALAPLEERADVILIDTGAGISANVLTFTRAADHVLVVTTPEPTAVTDAYAVIKVLSRSNTIPTDSAVEPASGFAGTPGFGGPAGVGGLAGRRISLLVNFVRTPAEGRGVYERIAQVARNFLGVTVHDAGCVYDDAQVSAAVRSRSPFVLSAPQCPASRCIEQLAIRLERGAGASADSMPTIGFFERMGRWFKK